MGILAAVLSLLLALPAWATPVRDVTMLYDPKQKTLHVEGDHPSDKLQKHYIRRAVVTIEGKEPQEFMFVRQDVPSRFSQDLAIELEKGDVVDVALYCSEGGVGRGHLEMPKEEKGETNEQTSIP